MRNLVPYLDYGIALAFKKDRAPEASYSALSPRVRSI